MARLAPLLAALLALLPAPAGAAATVVYRTVDGADLRADICAPSGAGPAPALVLVHGGGWTGGGRSDLSGQCAKAASSGFVGMAIDYRLAPAYRAPAAVEDLRAALAWIRANAATYKVDPNRVYALGASAGGHLALRVATAYPSEVRAVASWSGPTDLATVGGSEPGDYLGCQPAACPDLARSESPLFAVTSSTRPVFLAHARFDRLVPYDQATRMQAALKAAGVPVGTKYLAFSAAHGIQLDRQAWDASVAFLKAH